MCVFYWYNLLRGIFYISCDNWKTLLFIKVYCYPEGLFQSPCYCVLWTSVLKKVHIWFYLHNNGTILLPNFHIKFAVYYTCEISLFIQLYSFLIMFSDCCTFLYKRCFSNESQIFSESILSFTNMCQKRILLIPFIIHVYKGRAKSKLTRCPV